MPSEKIYIDWNYQGKADFLLGTGATQAERALVWAASLLSIALYGYFYLTHALNWAWWQYLLATIIAFDVMGGIVANSLNSCKRFYHTPAKPEEPSYSPYLKNHFIFSALHIYPLLVAMVFGTSGYFYGVFWYAWLLVSTLIILKTPLYLRRPVSFFVIALVLLLNTYIIAPVRGFAWLMPALSLKILYGHLVREEPYRPASGDQVIRQA